MARVLESRTQPVMTTVCASTLAPERSHETSAAASGTSAISVTAFVGTCVLIVGMPFETVTPLLSLPGQSLSSG